MQYVGGLLYPQLANLRVSSLDNFDRNMGFLKSHSESKLLVSRKVLNQGQG